MKHPFPHYLQHDAMDCGPTCLRMITAHYGKTFSLEGLRERSGITREGVSLLGISEAAEQLGFRTVGVKTTPCWRKFVTCAFSERQLFFLVLSNNTQTTSLREPEVKL